MKISYNLQPDTGRALTLLLALLLFLLISVAANAQSDTVSARQAKLRHERYLGYVLMTGVRCYTLTSNLSAIDGQTIYRTGGSVGVIAGNSWGMLRQTFGLYYSSPAFPYSVDVLESSVSANLYVLKFRSPDSHTFEPYLSLGAGVFRSSFFGTYAQGEGHVSAAGEPLLGRLTSYQSLIGAGVEYQLVNPELKFLHFFAEARWGKSFATVISNSNFADTRVSHPLVFSIGVSFGKIHQR